MRRMMPAMNEPSRGRRAFEVAASLLLLSALGWSLFGFPWSGDVACIRTAGGEEGNALRRLTGAWDIAFGVAYTWIPVSLVMVWLALRVKPAGPLLVLYGLFIVLCGGTHVMKWWNLFHGPNYWAAMKLSACGGAVSLVVGYVTHRQRRPLVGLGDQGDRLRRAEQEANAMRERAEAESGRVREFLEAAPDAMLVVERDGTVSLANAEAERVFGWPREELVGLKVEELVPEGRRGGHVAHREEYGRNPRVREMGASMNIEGRRKDGTTFAADIKLSPVGDAVIAAVRDVSARREAEREKDALVEELRDKNSRLESMSRTILELSTPIIDLEDGVLLLPIVGTFDSLRMTQIVEQASATVSGKGAEIVIIDVTGVHVMDSGVVDAFVRLAKVLALLGAKCVLTGIRGAVAQTMVEQGVAIEGFVTRATLKAGIREARAIAAARR